MNRPEPRDGFDAQAEADYFAQQELMLEGFEDLDGDSEDEDGDFGDDFDGQPSEYDEWMSYDPDC
jgi:hypothetical protein